MKITTAIITFNEESNIKECIESVKNFSDEILVVDSKSSDKTANIAKELGAKVIVRDWPGHVKQKQFAVDSAENDWIFSIDADERVSKELESKILEIKKNFDKWERFKAFYVNRRNYYLNRWIKYGGWYPEKRIRFFHKKFARWSGTDPHDKVVPIGNCEVFDLNLDIIHYPYKDVTHHFNTINSYSTIAAEENIKKGKKVYFPMLIYKPGFKFFRDYFLKKGFLMGKVGFIHATMGAISVFMKYLKTYEKSKKF